MKLYKFLKEDEQSDKQYRVKAQSFFNKLVSFVRSHKRYRYTKVTKGYWQGSLSMMASKIDPQYDDLILIFTTRTNKTFSGVSGPRQSGGGYIIALVVLDSDFAIEDIGKNIMGFNKGVFVHEFIHYLDGKRWSKGYEDFAAQAQKRDISKKPGSKEYFNNPFEFNAHFQEGVQKFINILSRSVKEKTFMVNKFVPDNPQKFIMIFKKSMFPKGFIENLTPENERKIDKRLYKLYDRIKHLRREDD